MWDAGRYVWNAVAGVAAGVVLAAVIRPGSGWNRAESVEAKPDRPPVARDLAASSSGPGGTAVPDPLPPDRPVATLYERPPSPPSIGALSSRVFIRSRPTARSAEIGTLALGTAVRRRELEPVSHTGCRRGWYAVEPEGYVCLDDSTTLDVDQHPLMRAKRHHRGDFSRPVPFAWGRSFGATPRYRRLPTESEQRGTEPLLVRHLERVRLARDSSNRQHRSLLGVDLGRPKSPIPSFLLDRALSPWSIVHTPGDLRAGYDLVPRRSTVAWTDEFFAEGRSWVLTDDLLVVPKDRLERLEPSRFSGRLLDAHESLPFAFVRGGDRQKYRLVPVVSDAPAPPPAKDLLESPFAALVERAARAVLLAAARSHAPVRLTATGDSWSRLSWVSLTGQVRVERGERFLEVGGGDWIRARDAAIVEYRHPRSIPAGEKWIDVSIANGTLVAYEGERPVFATLISPGANGYRRVDGKPARWTTPPGTFRIEWKHLSTTMSPDPERESFYLSQVPYTQFFHLPFALHAVYWHDRFGEPKSGGCVNLSVSDARWLFFWTEPAGPDGWHAVRSGGDRGSGTWVHVH